VLDYDVGNSEACIWQKHGCKNQIMRFNLVEPNVKKVEVCVGPIWSHDMFLENKEKWARIGNEKLGPNYKMTGHWWSKSGTSFVEFELI